MEDGCVVGAEGDEGIPFSFELLSFSEGIKQYIQIDPAFQLNRTRLAAGQQFAKSYHYLYFSRTSVQE